jgi:hypothetical protein
LSSRDEFLAYVILGAYLNPFHRTATSQVLEAIDLGTTLGADWQQDPLRFSRAQFLGDEAFKPPNGACPRIDKYK